MGSFAVGDVLLVSFPFSNLTRQKLRPAVVIGMSDYQNVILCQVTSKSGNGSASVAISSDDLDNAKVLPRLSYVRVNKIFTADPELISKNLGRLNKKSRSRIHTELTKVFAELA